MKLNTNPIEVDIIKDIVATDTHVTIHLLLRSGEEYDWTMTRDAFKKFQENIERFLS